MIVNVQAQDVIAGSDRIWWIDRWLTVLRTLPAQTDNHIELHVGKEPYVMFTTKHRREGVAVQRRERPCDSKR